MNSDTARKLVYRSAIILLFCLAALHVATARGLFADGAYFLLGILRDQAFTSWDQPRHYAHILSQMPVMLAMKLGVQNIRYLASAYTFGVLAVPALLYAWAVHKVRNDTFLVGAVTLVVAIVFQNANFFAGGEYVTAYALITCALAIVISEEEFTGPDCLGLVLISIVVVRSYESLVFLGPVVFVASVARFGYRNNSLLAAVTLLWVAFCFAAATAVAWWSIMYFPRAFGVRDGLDLSLMLKHRQFLVSVAIGFLYFGLIYLQNNKWATGLAIFLIVCCGVVLLPSMWAIPEAHYRVRAPVGAALLAVSTIVIIYRFVPNDTIRVRLSGGGWIAIVPFVLLCILSIPDFYFTLGWSRFLGEFRKEVNARSGITHFSETKLGSDEYLIYGWGWTYPTVSLLLRSGPSGSIILNPQEEGWQPFDPKAAIPDLHEFAWRVGKAGGV